MGELIGIALGVINPVVVFVLASYALTSPVARRWMSALKWIAVVVGVIQTLVLALLVIAATRGGTSQGVPGVTILMLLVAVGANFGAFARARRVESVLRSDA